MVQPPTTTGTTIMKYRLTYTSPVLGNDIQSLEVTFIADGLGHAFGWVRAFAKQVGLPLVYGDQLTVATKLEEVAE